MSTKAELQARLDALGIEYAKSASKAELEDLVAENELGADEPVDDPENPGDEAVAADDAVEPLEGTPVVDEVTEYVPLGEAGDDAPPEEPSDAGEAKDDTEELLEATPSETEVHDTTVGSTRPEDGYAAA